MTLPFAMIKVNRANPLSPTEQVLWKGHPSMKHSMKDTPIFFLIGVVMAIVVTIFTGASLEMGKAGGWFGMIMGYLFAMPWWVYLFPIVFMLVPLLSYLQAKTHDYYITDKRVLMVMGFNAFSVPYDKLASTRKQMKNTKDGAGSLDLIFKELMPWGKNTRKQITFHDILEIEKVENILLEHLT